MAQAAQPRPQTDPAGPAPAGRPRAKGPHYLGVLGELHAMLAPGWYLEIGSGRGHSLVCATGRSIAVDPGFRIGGDRMESVIGQKPELHLIQTTSDAFFAEDRLSAFTRTVDLAFIDGMHLFEFVLRDFINVEKRCTPESTILLHDMVPFSAAAAAREWDKGATTGWSGDVWKMAFILRRHRPDLNFRIFDARPSGLGVVQGINPKDNTLSEGYEDILAEYMKLDWAAVPDAEMAAIIDLQPLDTLLSPAALARIAAQ